MRKTALLLSFIVVLSALAGCRGLLNREVQDISPHMGETVITEDAQGGVEVTDYAMLLLVLREWVRAGYSEGTLRFSDFGGNVEQSLDEAFIELLYNDAYGRFVETYLTSETPSDGKTVRIRIRYGSNRVQSEIDALKTVYSLSAAREEISLAMRAFSPYLALELPFSAGTDFDPAALVKEIYAAQPLFALGLPKTDYIFYRGEKSPTAILEMRFEYPLDMAVMTARQSEAAGIVGEWAGQVEDGLSKAEKALAIHDLICEKLSYDVDRYAEDLIRGADRTARPYTILGAALDGRAVGEGYAHAYKALCNAHDIPCTVVTGQSVDGGPLAWNIVRLDGDWYAVDCSADDSADTHLTHDFFLKTDEALVARRYTWDTTLYPACVSEEISFESITGGADAADAETEETANGGEEGLPAEN
ncbi:MAG: hypothetical protein LBR85_04630 [Oscillospiraceae bacterium]|jgi:transglutaminase-like putative cysteine protease|nr:hypothetical protein [Oscillospiraceae bacterium]